MENKADLNEFISKYLDSECLNPRLVTNRYTGQKLYIPCNHCHACLLRKSNSQTALASNICSHFKFVFFVTLKYQDLYLPKLFVNNFSSLHLSESDRDDPTQISIHLGSCRILPVGERRIPKEYKINYVISRGKLYSQLKKVSGRYDANRKCVIYPDADHFQNYIPYVDKEDFSTFLKRLRISIQRKTKCNEKICYYAVSEYGPRTLRPHWHLLLCTNSPLIAENLVSLVHSTWQYGNIDISPSKGNASSYVASYVNSFVCLPDFYTRFPSFRPRCFHSKGFSANAGFHRPDSISDVQRCYDQVLNGIAFPMDGTTLTLWPSRSHQSLLFPRFNENVFPDSYSAYSLVRSLLKLPFWLIQHGYLRFDFPDFFDQDDNNIKGFNCVEFSRAMASYLMANYPIHQPMNTLNYRDDCVNYLILAIHRDPYSSSFFDYDLIVGAIYRLVSKIRRWLLAWKLHPDQSDFYKHIRLLIDYCYQLYNDKRLNTLNDLMTFTENCSPDAREYIKYVTVNENFYDAKIVNNFLKNHKMDVYLSLNKKIKHKEYNDMAGLLVT